MASVFNRGAFLRLAGVFAIVWAALIAAGVFSWSQMRAEVDSRARAEADRAVGAAARRLDEAAKQLGPLTASDVRGLRGRALAAGAPSLRGQALRFGGRAPGDKVLGGGANRGANGVERGLYAVNG
ncbi:MAG TPA: hypothetical protein VGH15_00080, partial [Caulobacteraceae bacterium]